MTMEELLFKVGLDQSAFATGIRSVEKQTEQLGITGEHSFAHAGSRAKEFHHLLQQIGETSPGVGLALKFMLDPVVALIALIVEGFSAIHEQMKSYNDQAADNLELMIKQDDILAESARRRSRELAELQRAHERWVQSHHDGSRKILDDLEDEKQAAEVGAKTAKARSDEQRDIERAAIRQATAAGGLNEAQARQAEAQSEVEAQNRELEAARTEAQAKVNAVQQALESIRGRLSTAQAQHEQARLAALAAVSDTGGKETELAKLGKDLAEANAANRKGPELGFWGTVRRYSGFDWWMNKAGADFSGPGPIPEQQAGELARRMRVVRAEIEAIQERSRSAATRNEEMAAAEDKLKTEEENLTKEYKKAVEHEKEVNSKGGKADSESYQNDLTAARRMESEKYRGTLEQIAQSGYWTRQGFVPGPGAPLANYIEWRQRMATQASIMGNQDLANLLIGGGSPEPGAYGWGATPISGLTKILQDAGMMKKDPGDLLGDLLDLAANKGMLVKAVTGD